MCMEDTGRMMMMTTMAACTTAGEMLASAAYAKVYIRAPYLLYHAHCSSAVHRSAVQPSTLLLLLLLLLLRGGEEEEGGEGGEGG